MSTTIRNKGVSHSDILHIPDELNLSNLTPSRGNIVTIENTKSLRIPRHPASGGSVDTRGENGQMRFNTISNIFEFYRNSNWTTLNYDSIGDRANTTFVSDTFPVPSNTFQFYGYNDGYGNKNFSSLTDLYSDASFQLFGGATLATTTGIYTDGTTSDWAAFPKEITNFGSNDFTISWWMTLDDLTSNSQILSLSYDADNSILIQYSSGNIQLVDKRDNSTTQSSQTLTEGTLYNYVLVREGLNFKLYLDRTEIIDNTTSAGYTFPDMYANYGTADYNTDNDNFVSFGASAPLGNTPSYTTSKIFRVDIWNKAINTQANIDNIYYNGYIYPFYSGMKMVVNNNMGVYIKPTDYTVQYINYNKGYVGIGNPDPQCMLDVSGSIGLHSLTIDDPDFEGDAKLYYKRGSGLALEISGNQYWSRTLLDSSATVFSTGSNADSLGHRIQTNFDNNMSFSNNSYDAPVPTAVNTVGPIVKIKDNAIVGKSFVDVESSAPSNALIIENALELNNSDVKSYFKDAIAGYFFEVDGGVGSIQDVVRGSGHAACDVSHNVYDETKLTNYGFDLSGENVSSFMSIPDMKIPSNGEFSICVRYFKSSTAMGEDIYNAGIQSIYTSSEQIGTLNIRTDSSDHAKLFIQFGGFKNDGYVNFTTSTGVLAINTWHFIVVNIKPHLSPEIYVNGVITTITTSLTNNDAIDGVTPDYPGNYGNLMLTPQKAYDNTSNNVSGTIDGVNIGTMLRPYSYTFGVGSASGNAEHKYYSTYMVFGRTLTSDDATFWTTALDGYEYCLGDLIKPHRGDKFNARNRVYIDNSYVLHSEDASFQTHASTRGDVKANRLVAGNVTLEHGKAIIATPSTTNGLISAYYFQKYGAKGSIEDDVRGNGYEIKDRLNDSYDSKTYLGAYGINHALTVTPDSYTGAQETDVTIVNSYCSVPSMQLPDTGVFTLQFRYYVKHDNQTSGSDNEFWRASIGTEGTDSRVTNSGTLSLIRNGGGIGNTTLGYQGWTLYAHDNDGGGKAFQINGNWKGYEVAQWNTLTLVIKPYSTPIIYLNGVFAPFTDATRYNIINSDWSGENIEPVEGTPTTSYANPQYITFGGYNGGSASAGGDNNFKYSTRQFQGYIGSYQVFNYALSPDDISYWFYALNGQGASKPKTLSVGKKQSNDRDHGINYDAKFDYVTKYNKSLQHISASDSMKMVISNQINMSHGNTLLYKQDQATRFGIKQSSNTDIDIALNPDVTMEVAHTFHTPNDFLFGGNDLSMTMHYLNTNSVNAVNNEIYNSNNDANFGNGSGETWKDWQRTNDNNGGGSTQYTFVVNATPKYIKLGVNQDTRYSLFNPGNYTNYVYSVDIKPVDDDSVGIVISMSQPNNFNSSGVAAYDSSTGFRFHINGGNTSTIRYQWRIYKSINGSFVEIALSSFISGSWNPDQYHRLKVIVINNTIQFYIIFNIDGTGTPTETLLYTHYDTDNIILQGNHFGVYNNSGENSLYKNIVLTELEFTDEITLQGIDNTIRIASNTISSDGDLRFIGDLNITGNLTLPHTIIENIKYKSSTHIKNVQTVNQIAEHVVIKPGNTSTESAVEIINTDSSKQFMTLNSGTSMDTDEKVRFNKSGVGIGTTNTENYALNVVGGNANCYGVYPVGSIIIFGGTDGQTNVPSGWLLCDGTLYDASGYPMLADIIGITYGGTTGTNFNVPNLSTRSAHGSADVTGINIASDENVSVDSSKTGGNKTLTTNQLASHSHTVDVNYSSSNWNTQVEKDNSSTSHSGGNGTFNKYFPFTYNYNSTNTTGVGRYAADPPNDGSTNNQDGIRVVGSASIPLKQVGHSNNNTYNAVYSTGINLHNHQNATGSGHHTNNQDGARVYRPSGQSTNLNHAGNIGKTIEKAHENVDVKYYYDVNSTRNISNVPNTIANSGNSADYYPPSTLVRYIIYSGVHNITTYPWI
jgi:microcystin-dependent protein